MGVLVDNAPKIDEYVRGILREGLDQNLNLFDEEIGSVVQTEKDRIAGCWSRYRYYYASRYVSRGPLNITPFRT